LVYFHGISEIDTDECLDYSRAEVKGKIDSLKGAEIKTTTEFKKYPFCIEIKIKDKYLPIAFKEEETMKKWFDILSKCAVIPPPLEEPKKEDEIKEEEKKPIVVETVVEESKVVFEAL